MKHNQALVYFEEALDLCEVYDIRNYIDFALQHKGKCYVELGEFELAIDCFKQALKIREEKGDTLLIQSTRQAFDFIERVNN